MPSESVQDHIHLSLPENLSGPPENAPKFKFKVLERTPEYEVYASFDRAWDGTPHVSSIADAQGEPRVFLNYRYTLRVRPEELAQIKAMLLRHLLLVDNEHCPDGQDHTPYIHPVRFMRLDYRRRFDPLLNWQEVEVLLQEEKP